MFKIVKKATYDSLQSRVETTQAAAGILLSAEKQRNDRLQKAVERNAATMEFVITLFMVILFGLAAYLYFKTRE